MINQQPIIMQPQELAEYQQQIHKIFVSDALLDYCQDIITHTRPSHDYRHGLSPRAGLALLHSARAWVMLEGRKEVLPEDIQAIIPATVGHRLQPLAENGTVDHSILVRELLEAVPVP